MTHRGWFFGLPETVRDVVWKKVRRRQALEAVSAMLLRRKSAVCDRSLSMYIDVTACFLIAPQRVMSLSFHWCLVTDKVLETVSSIELLDRVKILLWPSYDTNHVYVLLNTVQRAYHERVSFPGRNVYGEFGDEKVITYSPCFLTPQQSHLLL